MRQKEAKNEYTPRGVQITPETVERFLERQRQKLLTEDTIDRYALGLQKLREYIAPTGMIELGTLEDWQKELRSSGYSVGTVNMNISIANNLLDYLRRGDLKAEPLPADVQPGPELTRGEYLRLLQTARFSGKKRAYLLIKLFGTVPLSANDLGAVTVEAVRTGHLLIGGGKMPEAIYIPAALQQELLSYAAGQGIRSGVVFRSRTGTPYPRSRVTLEMQGVARDARVSPEKATPRALKKLCRKTLDEISENLRVLVIQNYETLLNSEQRAIGWTEQE